MNSQIASARIRETLRQLLRRQKHTLQDLAEHLGVSLATAKRLFADEDLGLGRLLEVCDFLGVSLAELTALADRGAPESPTYTQEQEEFLAADTRYLAWLLHLQGGHSAQAIAAKFGLSRRTTDRYVRDLERVGLVRVSATGRALPVHRESPGWIARGPLARAHASALVRGFHEFFADRITEVLAEPGEPEDNRITATVHVTPMSEESFTMMRNEVRQVIQKHLNSARVEEKQTGAAKLGRMALQFMSTHVADAADVDRLENIFGPPGEL